MNQAAGTPQTAEHLRLAESPNSNAPWRKWGPYVSERSWGTVREDYSADGNAWDFLSHDHARSKAYRWGEDGLAGICDRYQVLVFSLALWNERDPILKERLFGLTSHEGNHGEDVKEYYFYLDSTPTHSYMRYLYKYPQREFPYAQLISENRARGGEGREYELIDTGVFDDNRYFDVFVEYAKAAAEDICVRIEVFNRGPEDAPIHIIPQLCFRNIWGWTEPAGHEPEIHLGRAGDGFIKVVANDTHADRLKRIPFDYRLGPRHLYGEAGNGAERPPLTPRRASTPVGPLPEGEGNGGVSLRETRAGGTPAPRDAGGMPAPQVAGGMPAPQILFTDNETNAPRVYGPQARSRKPHTKDAFHRHIVERDPRALKREPFGTKCGFHYARMVPAGGSTVLRLRLTPEDMAPVAGGGPAVGGGKREEGGEKSGDLTSSPLPPPSSPLNDVDQIVTRARQEADEFYAAIHPPKATEDERLVQRQAFAGLLWGKQIYLFDVGSWLEGDNPKYPPPESRKRIRNFHWRHLNSMRILSMPDKWEYPWFAAWDLAFHCVTLAIVDPDFAKEQLWFMLFEQFQHPNGQIPAYEWEFSDLNPPVHAWACWRVYNAELKRTGKRDRAWLERCYHKLLINFAWWVNKVDSEGNNVFEGGFLGLDNITVLDRSEKLPHGVVLEQSDATGWMGMFCLNLMRIALELSYENKAYESLASKFFQHYIYVGAAMKRMGGRKYSLWDEQDGFFYDTLRYPDHSFAKFRVRSLVGLIPLYAIQRLEAKWLSRWTEFDANVQWFIKNRPHLVAPCCHIVEQNGEKIYVLSIVDEEQMKGILARVLDPDEFLSKFGIRSLSKYHEQHPFVFHKSSVQYEPAEAESKIKGGNSNWRGPIWFPTSFLMIESLRNLGKAYRERFKVKAPAECAGGTPAPKSEDEKLAGGTPAVQEREMTLTEMAEEVANRLIQIFTRDENGRRPVFGGCAKFQDDPHWKDCILFYEYFHGDNGAGLGAGHQTGWTALVASLIDEWRR
ncbi:MAG TPA: glucosidase [Planctomycetota bacterium]|nr:glucosidase [Planctomycetota bacterium]